MPSAKYMFLLPSDEVALANILREKFPDIRFYTHKGEPTLHYHYFEDIASTDLDVVHMVVAPPGWEPIYELFPWPPPFEKRTEYKVVNARDEVMFLRRSRLATKDGEFRVLVEGVLQVGVTSRMNMAQLSFANKIWRLLANIGTYQLQSQSRDGTWGHQPGKMWFAGNDAIKWALEDKRRYFSGNGRYRPRET
jgi:hypothetical protein